MPQGGRSVAFSNKQKKEQLKARKERKKYIQTSEGERKPFLPSLDRKDKFNKLVPQSKSNIFFQEVKEINCIPHSSRNSRYNLKFRKEAKPKLVNHHHEVVRTVSFDELEKGSDNFFPVDLNYPHRPAWKKNMSKAELEQSENKSFRLFCEDIDKRYEGKELSLYELNLETWRQLWRVTEISEILLVIVDARFSAAQFPPYLYHYLVEEEKKGVILILNKCDLLLPSLVIAWQDYFTEKFPKLIVVPFSSMERKSLKKSTLVMAYESAKKLVDACEKLVKKNVEFNLWRQKIEEERESDDFKCKILKEHESESLDPQLSQKFKDGILTIGTIGHPNVGKSSVINALMGKKVVSVSKTPGHTKYFQTIFLTKNIKLCDCPGLVFPSLCPKDFQIIIGSYPIAQVRDPIATVSYIASRLDLPYILKLSPESLQSNDSLDAEFHWTPFLICEAWANKRGYFTKTKGGHPDIHRAANELLRFTLVGYKNIMLSLSPPGYSSNKAKYESDPRQIEIEKIQGVHSKNSYNAMQAEALTIKLRASESEESSSDDDSCNSDEEMSDNAAISGDDESDENILTTANSNKFALLNVDE